MTSQMIGYRQSGGQGVQNRRDDTFCIPRWVAAGKVALRLISMDFFRRLTRWGIGITAGAATIGIDAAHAAEMLVLPAVSGLISWAAGATVGTAVAIGTLGLAASALGAYERRRAAAKLREQAARRAGIDIRPQGGGGELPLVYGATAVPGRLAYPGSVRASTTEAMIPSGSGFGELAHGSDKSKAWLLVQWALCAGEIEGVVDVHLNGVPITDDVLKKSVALEVHQSTASTAASAFADDRDATAVFHGLCAATAVLHYDVKRPVWSGVPHALFFVHGRKVPSVVRSGSAGSYTYSVSATKTYSSNAVRCLLDYLLDTRWGAGLTADDLDLESFYRAQEAGDQVMQGASSSLWSLPYPTDLNELWGTAYATWGAYFTALGFSSATDSGLDSWHGQTAPPVRRFEFHGAVLRPADRRAAIGQFMDVIPGGRLFQDLTGRLKIGFPDPDEAGVALTLTDEELLMRPELATIDPDQRLNALTLEYPDTRLDLAAASVTWPPPGSAVDKKLLAQDGSARLQRGEPAPHVNNVFAASARAASRVLMSRRDGVTLDAAGAANLLEPGDRVQVTSKAAGFNDQVLVLEVGVSRQFPLAARLKGVLYRDMDYRWESHRRAAALTGTSLGVDVPSLSDVSLTLSGGDVRSLLVAWTLPSTQDAIIGRVDVQLAEFTASPGSDDVRNWEHIGAAQYDGINELLVTGLSNLARWYEVRARPVSVAGIVGDWVTSDALTAPAISVGAAWHSGSGAPSGSLGKVGDWYINLSSGAVYRKTGSSTWTLQGNIKGADGDAWHSGSGAPSSSLGSVGDWYFRTSSDQIYQKTASSTWTLRTTIAPPKWTSSSSNPSSGSGSVGDYHLNTSTGDVYRKTGSSTWTKQGNIKGGDGDAWHSGSGAPSSSLGSVGDWYFRTSSDQIYQKTASSTWTLRTTIAAPKWTSSSSNPSSSSGSVGDYHLNTSTGDVYRKTGSSTWTKQGNIKGGDGDAWHSGSGAPSSSLGSVGDWYFRTSSDQIYQKTASSTWTLRTTIAAPKWTSSSSNPSSSSGSVGDYHLNTSTGDVYRKTGSSTWTKQGNIKGGDGDAWHSGSGAPSSSLGSVGDWYFRTSSDQIYQKTASSTWTLRTTIAAPKWTSSSSNPSSGSGSVGDYHLNTSTGDVYRKTGSSTWTLQGNIKGGDGDAWHSGSGAPSSSLGSVGDWYLRTSTNGVYQKTGSSTWTLRTTLEVDLTAGSVQTTHIAQGAVTATSIATSSTVSLTSSWQTLSSIVVPTLPSGSVVIIRASVYLRNLITGAPGTLSGEIRMRRDSANIDFEYVTILVPTGVLMYQYVTVVMTASSTVAGTFRLEGKMTSFPTNNPLQVRSAVLSTETYKR